MAVPASGRIAANAPILELNEIGLKRHARACRGHPRLFTEPRVLTEPSMLTEPRVRRPALPQERAALDLMLRPAMSLRPDRTESARRRRHQAGGYRIDAEFTSPAIRNTFRRLR